MTDFTARVLAIVRRIPPGRVATYGDVAATAGRPRAHRAVGNIMRECSDKSVPCQRVVAAGGAIGGYGGNVQLKKELLRAEGLMVVGKRIRGFAKVRWTAVSGSRTPKRPAGSGSRPKRKAEVTAVSGSRTPKRPAGSGSRPKRKAEVTAVSGSRTLKRTAGSGSRKK